MRADLGAWSYKLAEVVAELRRLDADVVLLQEVDWCHAPDDAPTPFTHDAFHEIASALGLAGIWAPHYAYRGTSPLSFPFPSPPADRRRVSCAPCRVRRGCQARAIEVRGAMPS
jgi:endonuclease/exonuclease/phosphatase family metal-dependent hydrolase